VTHAGKPDGAQKYCIGGGRRLLRSRRHIASGLPKAGGAGVEKFVAKRQAADPPFGCSDDGEGSIGDVHADAVTLDDGNPEFPVFHTDALDSPAGRRLVVMLTGIRGHRPCIGSLSQHREDGQGHPKSVYRCSDRAPNLDSAGRSSRGILRNGRLPGRIPFGFPRPVPISTEMI